MKPAPFSWPEDVKAEREALPGGAIAYHFTHDTMGELGRIVLTPVISGGCALDCGVFAPGGAAVVAKRKAILEPLARMISAKLGGR